MPRGRKPAPEAQRRLVTVSSRVTRKEKEIIQATARQLKTDVCALLYSLAMAEAERLNVFAGSQSRD